MTLSYRQRLGLLAVFGGCGALLVLARLVTLQVVEHRTWVAKAYSDDGAPSRAEGARARILDARGRVLAQDELAFDLVLKPAAWEGRRHECSRCGKVVYYLPDQLPGRPKCPRCRRADSLEFTDRRSLAPVAAALGMPAAELLRSVEERAGSTEVRAWAAVGDVGDGKWDERLLSMRRDLGWRSQVLVSDVPYEVAREVELHPEQNPAFRIELERCRRYPGGADFVHVVGREPADGSPGRGLEAALDAELRGESRWLAQGTVVRREGHAGRTVQLTIDAEDQRHAMEALSGIEGAFVVVDASSGAVLALASAPSYDPRGYRDLVLRLREEEGARGPSPLIDRAYAAGHVPGSIVKPITAIAALHAGVARPTDRILCEQYFTFRGQRYTRWLRCHGLHDELDLHGALVRSCNIYFQTLMVRLIDGPGFGAFLDTGRRFGLGAATGLEMEPSRIAQRTFRIPEGRRQMEYLAAATGQGSMLLSPAQVARAYAGLATGRLPRLHVVARVGDRSAAPRSEDVGIDGALLDEVRGALRDVPRAGGSAAGHGLQAWGVSCKTGTAEKGGDLQNAWIAGFVPAREGGPPIAFAMVVLDTRENGAEACAPRLRGFLRHLYGEGGSG